MVTKLDFPPQLPSGQFLQSKCQSGSQAFSPTFDCLTPSTLGCRDQEKGRVNPRVQTRCERVERL